MKNVKFRWHIKVDGKKVLQYSEYLDVTAPYNWDSKGALPAANTLMSKRTWSDWITVADSDDEEFNLV